MPGGTTSSAARWAATLVAVVALSSCTADEPPGAGPSRQPERRIAHAQWHVRAERVGGGRLAKPLQRRAPVLRRSAVTAVKRSYGALFGSRRRRAALRGSFSRRAARVLLRSRAGVPERARLLATVRRRARVRLQGPRLTRAAAEVRVVARIRLGKRRVRLVHDALLWLERTKRTWRVIAFEFDQRRAS